MWFKKYTIEDLKRNMPATLHEAVRSFALHRKDFKILIIDDNEVPISSTLKSLEYVVSEEKDVKSPAEADRFDLILCDRRGVGKSLGSVSGGVFLAKKIKERYPFKPVILYSSSKFEIDDFEAVRTLDDVILDAPETDTFSNYVDDQVKDLLNPVLQWQKLHVELARRGFPARYIAKLEDDYVRQLCKTGKYSFSSEMFPGLLYSAIKDLLVGFATQSIFTILATL